MMRIPCKPLLTLAVFLTACAASDPPPPAEAPTKRVAVKAPTQQEQEPREGTLYWHVKPKQWKATGDPERDVVYVGKVRDGVPHGQGTHTLADGSKYIGEHKNGKPDGQGTAT